MREEQLRTDGVRDPDAAAKRGFGNPTRLKEESRQAWTFQLLEEVWVDCRHAVRGFRRARGFTAVAVLSLALGIGATTAVYSTVDWLLNRPPGNVIQPERVMALRTLDETEPQPNSRMFSYKRYEDLRAVQNAFSEVAAYGKLPGVVSTEERADQVVFETVTGSYFPLLGVRPAVGRVITPDDDIPGAPTVAMLSHEFWLSHFGGDPGILDNTVRLNGQLCRVVGIVPRDFEGYHLDWNGPTRVWVPMSALPSLFKSTLLERDSGFFPVIGRLKPDQTVDLARDRASSWAAALNEMSDASYQPTTILVDPANETRIVRRYQTREFFGLLLIVCVLILLAACFNIANFLIGSSFSRRREFAMRTALGATRWRVLRQLLVESMVIGVCASIAGFVFAAWLVSVLSAAPRLFLGLPLTTESAIDGKMAAIAMALGIISTAAFGLMPAAIVSLSNPMRSLRGRTPHWSWVGLRVTPRQAILVLQVSLAVMLVVTAGLYARSLSEIASVESGYRNPESILVARIVPNGFTQEDTALFYDQFFSRLEALPEEL